MMQGITRRLEKLEQAAQPADALDLARAIEEGRARVRAMAPAELRAEQRAHLAEMEQLHAERPLRGRMLAILEGRRRAAAAVAVAAEASL